MLRRATDRDAGSAPVEFVLIGGLLLALAALLLQLGLTLFVRNTAIWCAAEGARAGARRGAAPDAAVRRTTALLTDALSQDYARSVTASRRQLEGLTVIEVSVRTPVPLLGLAGPQDALAVRARALDEDQR